MIKTAYIELEPDEAEAVKKFLLGKLGARPLGEKLGVSHQQALNLMSSVCRQWVREGILIFAHPVGKSGE